MQTPCVRRCVALVFWLCALPFAPATVSATEVLRVAVSRTPLSLPLYVAQTKGYFAAEGVEVHLDECIGGHRCLKQMLDGQADLATATELPVVLNSFERTDYAILATFVSASEDLKLIARTDSPSDRGLLVLKGKRIGVVIGSSAQYFLDLHLLTVGIDPRELRVIGFPPEAMPDALASGKVDAIAVWEPYGFMAMKALGPKARVVPASNGYIQTFNLIAHRRLLGSRDVAFTRFLQALHRAEKFIQQEPEAAKAILRKRLALDQEFIDWVWPSLAFRLALDQSLISTMESEARWAQREGHITGKTAPNFLSMVHASPLKSVKPTAVGVGR